MITLEKLKEIVPAAFSEMPAPHVSQNYQFVQTSKVLEELEKRNWVPIFGKQQKSKTRKESTKHTIMLRHRDIAAANPTLGKTLPTLRLINSHDWSCIFQLVYGMLVLRCGNGLFFAGEEYQNYQLRHDSVMQDLEMVLGHFQETSQRMEDTAKRWNQIELTATEELQLAEKGAQIRFGDSFTGEHVSSLMIAHHGETSSSLWDNFNKVQGNIIRGGNKVGKRKTRSVNNIQREKEMNEQLFLAAKGFDK